MFQALTCLSTASFTWSGEGFGEESRHNALRLTSGSSGISVKEDLDVESG